MPDRTRDGTVEPPDKPPRRRPAGKHEGAITRLPSGTYTVQVTLGKRADGKPNRVRLSDPDPAKLRRRRNELVRRFEQQQQLDRAAERQPLATYMATWLDGKRGTIEPFSWRRYEIEVTRHLGPHVGDVPLGVLTPEHLRRTYRALLETLSPRSVQYAHVTIKQVLKQAVRDGLLDRNVADAVDPPKRGRTEARALTPDEVRRLLAAAWGDWYALWLLALYSGLRSGELLGLGWTSVLPRPDGTATLTVQRVLADAEDGTPVLRDYPKSSAGVRTIHLPARVVQALDRQRERQAAERAAASAWEDTAGLVFTSRFGTPLLRSNVVRRLQQHASAAGIAGALTVHELRHTFASSLLAAGRPITEVAYLLGHANSGTTLRIYAHFVRGEGHQAPAALESHYGHVDLEGAPADPQQRVGTAKHRPTPGAGTHKSTYGGSQPMKNASPEAGVPGAE